MVAAYVNIGELLDGGLVGCAAAHRVYKKIEKLLYNVSGGCAARADNPDHIRAVEISSTRPLRAAVDALNGVVMLWVIHDKLVAEQVGIISRVKELPAGESSRNLFHVLLSVVRFAGHDVGDAHREKLLKLTRKILVGLASHIGDAVEPEKHRWILSDS